MSTSLLIILAVLTLVLKIVITYMNRTGKERPVLTKIFSGTLFLIWFIYVFTNFEKVGIWYALLGIGIIAVIEFVYSLANENVYIGFLNRFRAR